MKAPLHLVFTLTTVVLGAVVLLIAVPNETWAISYVCNNDICTPERAEYRDESQRMICLNSVRLKRFLTQKRLLVTGIGQLEGCARGLRPPTPLGCVGWRRRLERMRAQLAQLQIRINRIVVGLRFSCNRSRDSINQCERVEAEKYCPIDTEEHAAESLTRRCQDIRNETQQAQQQCKPQPGNCNVIGRFMVEGDQYPEIAALMGFSSDACPSPTAVPTTVPTTVPSAAPSPAPSTTPPAVPSATPSAVPTLAPTSAPVATPVSSVTPVPPTTTTPRPKATSTPKGSGSCKDRRGVGPECDETEGAT